MQARRRVRLFLAAPAPQLRAPANPRRAPENAAAPSSAAARWIGMLRHRSGTWASAMSTTHRWSVAVLSSAGVPRAQDGGEGLAGVVQPRPERVVAEAAAEIALGACFVCARSAGSRRRPRSPRTPGSGPVHHQQPRPGHARVPAHCARPRPGWSRPGPGPDRRSGDPATRPGPRGSRHHQQGSRQLDQEPSRQVHGLPLVGVEQRPRPALGQAGFVSQLSRRSAGVRRDPRPVSGHQRPCGSSRTLHSRSASPCR